MDERRECKIRPRPSVCPGAVAFTLHPPGGGSGLRFTRPHHGVDGKAIPGVIERSAQLTRAQAEQLEHDGYDVDGWQQPPPKQPRRRRSRKAKE